MFVRTCFFSIQRETRVRAYSSDLDLVPLREIYNSDEPRWLINNFSTHERSGGESEWEKRYRNGRNHERPVIIHARAWRVWGRGGWRVDDDDGILEIAACVPAHSQRNIPAWNMSDMPSRSFGQVLREGPPRMIGPSLSLFHPGFSGMKFHVVGWRKQSRGREKDCKSWRTTDP